jgi:hypothetical protein
MDVSTIVGTAVKEAVAAAGAGIMPQPIIIPGKKPGYCTTEFGMATAVIAYLLGQDLATHNWVYASLAAGLALGYSIVRAYCKT